MSTQPRRQQEVREDCLTRFNNYTSRIGELLKEEKNRDRDRRILPLLSLRKTTYTNRPCKKVFYEYCNKLENLETGFCWNWFKTFAYNYFREEWKGDDPKDRRKKVSNMYNAYKAKRQRVSGSATGTGTGTVPSQSGGGRNSRGKTTTKVSKRTRNIKSKSRAGKKGKTSTRVRRQTGGCHNPFAGATGKAGQDAKPHKGQQLSEKDKRDLLTLLAEIQDKVKKYVDGLSDDQVDYQLEALLAQQAQQAQLGPPLTQAQVAVQLEELEASLAHQGQQGQLALTPQLAQVRAQLAQASKKLDQVRGHLVRI